MQDWGRRRPDARGKDRPSAVPKDPRTDSEPPAAAEEMPLVARRVPSRPRSDVVGRISALELEIARLTEERARDADQIGEMLVRVAGAERSRAAAENRAAAAQQEAAGLRADLANLRARSARLGAGASGPGGRS